MKWLDVGCGRGELLELAGNRFALAAGCDPSQKMLSLIARREVQMQPSPVELPFSDSSFDLITVVCVMHHVHGQGRSLLTNEMRRVLRQHGFGCIIEHNPWNPVTRTIVNRCPVDVDAELITAREVNRLLAASGFTTVRKEFFLYLPERFFYRYGAIERALSILPFGGQYALLSQVHK
jgi:SAM-dependent methyltransferase